LEITAQDFRDGIISEISIGFDWSNNNNFAILKIKCADSGPKSYRINDLIEFNIYEDFKAMYIERCTLIKKPNEIYLSLDPFIEDTKAKEKDNYYFNGRSIEQV